MTTFSCKGCEKRTPGCHARCEKYLKEKAEYDRLKAAEDKRRDIQIGIWEQRSIKVDKATKRRWKRGKYEQ
jgi:hypothetical protein